MAGTLKKIIIVEDNESLLKTFSAILSEIGNISSATTAREARQLLQDNSFDLALLDIELPDSDGYHLCTEIRSHKKHGSMPIIFVSGKSDTTDKIMGLQLGADDYITKPFNPEELKARVGAVLRRSSIQKPSFQENQIFKVGNLELNLTTKKVIDKSNAGNKISLTTIEYKILELLIKNIDRVYSRTQMIDLVWGNETHVTERTVDTHVSKLRKKLGPIGDLIQSVHGFGYKISEEDYQFK